MADFVKGPACRQSSETRKDCVTRKIAELIEIDGMERDQAVAVANKLCDKQCSEKGVSKCGVRSRKKLSTTIFVDAT